ncbi:MAG: ATP-binding protein [Patescibacteria group bacterium]
MPKNYSESKQKWYVITGGPSSGKTTILKELGKIGYITYPETSRSLIDKEKAHGETLKEIRGDEAKFQRKVLEMKVQAEKRAPKNKIIFFDRAIPDSIAYYQVCGLDGKEVLKFCKRKIYKKVFFLEQLPVKKDYARTENNKTVRKLNQFLKEAYKKLGYNVVDIPVTPVEKRVALILKEVKNTF